MEKNSSNQLNFPPLSELDFYVENPKEIQEQIGTFIQYTLKGKRLEYPIERRYREFDYLRIKLKEKFPGIIIPNLPHKKKIGEKQKKIVNMRIEQINRFCFKISKLPFYHQSMEIDIFLQNTNDTIKSLDNIVKENYFEISQKYERIFGEIPEDFIIENYKNKHFEFIESLKNKNLKLNELKTLIENFKDKYQKSINNYIQTINVFSVFEKEAIKEYVNNKSNRLIFFNLHNKDFNQKLIEIQQKLMNPYIELLDNLTGDLLDNESIIETYNDLLNLQQIYSKNKNINKEPEKTNMIGLEKIIRYSVYCFDKVINDFKDKSLQNYYFNLSILIKTYKNNNKIIDNMLDSLLSNPNISSI